MKSTKNNKPKVKTLKFKPNISENDFNTKKRQIEKWLKKGLHVELYVIFPGRNVIHPENGVRLFDEVLNDLQFGKMVSRTGMKGNSMKMFLAPSSTKK